MNDDANQELLPAVSAPEAVDRSVPPAAAGRTILVVEDEEAVRQFIVLILQKLGYRVLEASGGEEALALCKSLPGAIALVITDMMMPRMSGPQMVEALRLTQPGIRTLFVSGYGADDTLNGVPLRQVGAGFLEKPFTKERLDRKIREILSSP